MIFNDDTRGNDLSYNQKSEFCCNMILEISKFENWMHLVKTVKIKSN